MKKKFHGAGMCLIAQSCMFVIGKSLLNLTPVIKFIIHKERAIITGNQGKNFFLIQEIWIYIKVLNESVKFKLI